MKKVLYITYYWEPCGGIGPLRSLKFAKYFKQCGWDPTIYAPQNAAYPLFDYKADHKLPKDITILKKNIFEPYAVFNVLTGNKRKEVVKDVFAVSDGKEPWTKQLGIWVRGNFFVPDARKFWIKPSVKYLKKYIEENKIDAIISHGPPHSTHLIALALKKHFGIPWIADFQDPWTQVDYFHKFKLGKRAGALHHKQEAEVLKHADKVVIVSRSWTKDLGELAQRPVNYIPWGFDPEDFSELKPYHKSDKFILSHFGTFGSDRNPTELWEALGKFAKENSDFANRLEIQLAGSIDISIVNAIEKNGLKNNLNNLGFINRTDALQRMGNSDILLLALNRADNVNGRIPAKIFEYLACKRPVLVIGPHTADVPNIVKECKAGLTAEFNNVDEAYQAIKYMCEDYMGDSHQFKFENIEQYHADKITNQMSDLLDEIIIYK